MRTTIINNKTCSTIEEFYSINVPKIRYSQTKQPIPLVCDFYQEFLVAGKRLPDKKVVEEWHDLLIWYINQPDATFFVRKYEGGKKNGEWDNRRGAVIQFDDGFEIAYSSNFLAHDIFLMAYYGFVPDKKDFMTTIKKRKFHITSGTKVEKEIRTYTLANKGLSYCYLAHIMDVNGDYLRDDRTYTSLSNIEENKMFPRGIADDWKSSIDGIWHVNYSLSREEIDLVKAHCIRFLDPMNYYLTPLTNQSSHTIKSFKKNIGEYRYLTYYIERQYKHIFGNRFDELITEGKYLETAPKGYTGKEIINLEYSSKKNGIKGFSSTSSTTSKVKLSGSKKTASTSKSGNNEFADFEVYAVHNRVSNPPYYSSLIKSIMKELNVNSITDLEANIDIIIDDCTQKIDAAKKAKDKSTAKKYNNIRSALRKYSDYLDQKYNAINNIDVFVKTLEDFMRNAGDLSDGSIRIYLRKIRDLLENGYTIEQICAEIDGIIKSYSKDGQCYDPNDHNNTKCALDQIAKMIKYPYIRYKKGWDSFLHRGEYLMEYCIKHNAITISYGNSSTIRKTISKKISSNDMKELIEILDIAGNNALFEKSNTHIITEHGPISSYDYQYRDKLGVNCRGLFIDNKMSETLQTRYSNLINNLIK